MTAAIRALAHEKNAVILAHYYQTPDLQAVADFVGDSFEMARRAAAEAADIIVVCGVRFMAESAKLLAPEKTVLLPALDAGCPMADMITPEDVLRLRAEHPGAVVVTYVNSSADVKAVSDICCTSSSAVRIVRSLPENEIIFVPDQNLGAYVQTQCPEKTMHLFDGFCPIHHAVTREDVQRAKTAHPNAAILVHPECKPEVLEHANGIGSTSWILAEAEKLPRGAELLIGTEVGVLEILQIRRPDLKCFLLKSGFLCPNMKKTTLEDVLHVLETGANAVTLPPDVIAGARKSLERMVAVN